MSLENLTFNEIYSCKSSAVFREWKKWFECPSFLPMLACRYLTCLFFGMYEQIFAMLVSLHPCPVNVKGERHIIYENAIDYTHQHCCLIFSLGVWQFSLVWSLECVCSVCSYWMISKQKFCFYTNLCTVKSCLTLSSQFVCMGKLASPYKSSSLFTPPQH